MTKLICDRCGRHVPELKEMHLIRVTNCENDKPSIPAMEVCVFCKVELDPVIRSKSTEAINTEVANA